MATSFYAPFPIANPYYLIVEMTQSLSKERGVAFDIGRAQRRQ